MRTLIGGSILHIDSFDPKKTEKGYFITKFSEKSKFYLDKYIEQLEKIYDEVELQY